MFEIAHINLQHLLTRSTYDYWIDNWILIKLCVELLKLVLLWIISTGFCVSIVNHIQNILFLPFGTLTPPPELNPTKHIETQKKIYGEFLIEAHYQNIDWTFKTVNMTSLAIIRKWKNPWASKALAKLFALKLNKRQVEILTELKQLLI